MLGNSPFFQNNIAIKSHLKYLQEKRWIRLKASVNTVKADFFSSGNDNLSQSYTGDIGKGR